MIGRQSHVIVGGNLRLDPFAVKVLVISFGILVFIYMYHFNIVSNVVYSHNGVKWLKLGKNHALKRNIYTSCIYTVVMIYGMLV